MESTATPLPPPGAARPRGNNPARPAAPEVIQRSGGGGVRLVASTWGDPKAPPVILLHGFGQTRHAWNETGASLARAGYYALAPDARGHGMSGFAPDGVYRLDDFVADVQVLSAGLRRPVLVGASMGGMVGMLAEAEQTAPLLRALVLVDIVPSWSEAGVERILAFMKAQPEGFDSLEDAAAAVGAYLPHRRARKVLEGLKPYLRETGSGRLVWHWDARLLQQIGPESAPYHHRLMSAARLITCPTLLISGAESDVVNQEAIVEFLQAVPHAEHVELPGARHMVAGDTHQAFTATVLVFLHNLDKGAP